MTRCETCNADVAVAATCEAGSCSFAVPANDPVPRNAERPSGPEIVAKHLDRLAESLPSVGPAWDGFRALIESRVAEGQRRYGDRWLRLELIDEALEELADCCAYVAAEAHNHSEQDVDLSLTASHHALLAAEALATLRAKRCGSP